MNDLRQYLIRIAVINWLLSLFKANPELCTYEGLMDELAAWLLSDTCAREGCDNPLIGYPSNAFYCSDYCRYKARFEKPQRKAYNKIYSLAIRQLPESKAYQRDYQKAWHEAHPDYQRDYQRDYRARKKAERLAAIEAE